jgi:hypothetical protein
LFLRGILYYGLELVMADWGTWYKTTSSRATEGDRFLGTASDGSELLHILLLNITDLPRPLGTLGVGCVTRSLILTLLFIDGFT